jgi:hypothetical protein
MAINAGKAEVTVVGKYKDEITSKSQKAFAKFKAGAVSAMKGAAVAVIAFGAAIIALGVKLTKQIDKIDKMALRLGISTEALSQYGLVAGLAGVNTEAMTVGLQRMTRRIAEAATGTGVAVDALRELGLPMQDLADQNPDEQFLRIADALSQVDDQGKKVLLAFKLFDTEGVGLLQTMEKGRAGIEAFKDEADDMGLTITELEADKIAKMNDAWTRLTKTIEGLGTRVLIQLSDSLTKFINWMRENAIPAINTINRIWTVTTNLLHKMAAFALIATGALANLIGAEKTANDMFGAANKIMEDIIKNSIKHNEVNLTLVQSIDKKTKKMKGWNNAMADTEIELLQMKQALQDTFATPSEDLQDFISLMNVLVEQNVASASEAMDLIDRKLGSMAEKAKEEATAMMEFVERVGQTTEDAMVRALQGTESGWESMRNVALSVIQDIQRAMIRSQIIEPLFGGGKDGGKGVFGTLLEGAVKWGSTYFAQNALGGQVPGGVPTIVGERGPELFTPSGAGSITPNNQMGGGQPITIVQHIEVGTAQTVRQEMMNMMPMFIDQAKQAIADERQRSPAFSALMGV